MTGEGKIKIVIQGEKGGRLASRGRNIRTLIAHIAHQESGPGSEKPAGGKKKYLLSNAEAWGQSMGKNAATGLEARKGVAEI